ncbi:MAG: hypothetical protein Q3990_09490, partial [Desulfovibrionaceae bacterium]|nr:hypothetical protein [Desulfovibrionaceae bacterium]
MTDTRMPDMRKNQPYAPQLMERGTEEAYDELGGLYEDDAAILEACSQMQNTAYADESINDGNMADSSILGAPERKRGRRKTGPRKKDPSKPAGRRGRRKAVPVAEEGLADAEASQYGSESFPADEEVSQYGAEGFSAGAEASQSGAESSQSCADLSQDAAAAPGKPQTLREWRRKRQYRIADFATPMSPEEKKAFEEEKAREFEEALREKRVPMMKYLKPGTDMRKVTLREAKQMMRARLGLVDNGVVEHNQAPITHFCSDDGVPCWRNPKIVDDVPGAGTADAVSEDGNTAGSRGQDNRQLTAEAKAGRLREDEGRYEKEPEKAEEEAEECHSREAERGAHQDGDEDKEAKAKKLFLLIPVLVILAALAVWFSWSGVFQDAGSGLHEAAGPEVTGPAAGNGRLAQNNAGQSPDLAVAHDKTRSDSHAWPEMADGSYKAVDASASSPNPLPAASESFAMDTFAKDTFGSEPFALAPQAQDRTHTAGSATEAARPEAAGNVAGTAPSSGDLKQGRASGLSMEERLKSFEESLQKTEKGMRLLQQMLLSGMQKATGQQTGQNQAVQEDGGGQEAAAAKNRQQDQQAEQKDMRQKDVQK